VARGIEGTTRRESVERNEEERDKREIGLSKYATKEKEDIMKRKQDILHKLS